MCLFCKIKHSFTLCLSTLYLSLVPDRSVIFLSVFCERIYQIHMLYPRKLYNFKKRQSVSLWNFPFTLYPSLDPYRHTERQTETEYTPYAWAGGTFFQLCSCVSFLVVAELVLGDTYLPYQLCHCVFFVVVAGNSVWLHRPVFWF